MKNKFFTGLVLISALALSACTASMPTSGASGPTNSGGGGSSASKQSQTPAESQAESGATTAGETHGPEVTDSNTGEGLGFGSISG